MDASKIGSALPPILPGSLALQGRDPGIPEGVRVRVGFRPPMAGSALSSPRLLQNGPGGTLRAGIPSSGPMQALGDRDGDSPCAFKGEWKPFRKLRCPIARGLPGEARPWGDLKPGSSMADGDRIQGGPSDCSGPGGRIGRLSWKG